MSLVGWDIENSELGDNVFPVVFSESEYDKDDPESYLNYVMLHNVVPTFLPEIPYIPSEPLSFSEAYDVLYKYFSGNPIGQQKFIEFIKEIEKLLLSFFPEFNIDNVYARMYKQWKLTDIINLFEIIRINDNDEHKFEKLKCFVCYKLIYLSRILLKFLNIYIYANKIKKILMSNEKKLYEKINLLIVDEITYSSCMKCYNELYKPFEQKDSEMSLIFYEINTHTDNLRKHCDELLKILCEKINEDVFQEFEEIINITDMYIETNSYHVFAFENLNKIEKILCEKENFYIKFDNYTFEYIQTNMCEMTDDKFEN